MDAITTITKNQYKDLECYIGKKNLITKVTGNEYKIDTASETTFSEGTFTLTPEELRQKSIAGAEYKLLKSTKDLSSEGWWLRTFGQAHYLREECYYLKGTYFFNITNTLITQLSSVVLNYQIKYCEYNGTEKIINKSNYKSSSRRFTTLRSWANRPSDTRGDSEQEATDYDYTTSGCIPHSTSKTSGLVPDFETPGITWPNQIFDMTFISKDRYFKTLDTSLVSGKTYYTKSGSTYNEVNSPNVSNIGNYYEMCEAGKFCYQFQVNYLVVVSTGRHTEGYNFWGTNDTHENKFCEITGIDITVKGLSVNEEQVEKEVGKGTKTLELKTNELMQSSISDADSMFDRVAQQIITAYKDNRVFVKFKLINNELIVVDGVERYLRAGDVIKIKDGHDKYIKSYTQDNAEIGCDFEIIKANSKFNGFFYKEITAKEILN